MIRTLSSKRPAVDFVKLPCVTASERRAQLSDIFSHHCRRVKITGDVNPKCSSPVSDLTLSRPSLMCDILSNREDTHALYSPFEIPASTSRC